MPNEQGDAKWHLASNAWFSVAREQCDFKTLASQWSNVMPNEQGDAKWHLASNACCSGAREQCDSETLASHGPM
jgi:hypothetical protein